MLTIAGAELKAAASAVPRASSSAALLEVTTVDVHTHLHKYLAAEENSLLLQIVFHF